MFSANTSQVSDDKLFVEDVFSTYLYSGTSGAQSINNGIDTLNKGGLVWMKNRGSALSHILIDTAQGCTFAGGKNLISNSTNAAGTIAANTFQFDSTGFSFGSAASGGAINASGNTYASWTFRKAPKFFDVVTYTGDGVGPLTVNHNLGVSPGCIIIKRTNSAGDWFVFHRSLSGGFVSNYLKLNTTDASLPSSGGMTVSATNFQTYAYAGANDAVNESGATYVAYLFAHDATSDGIIQCGSYTGNGSSNTITLGWEPQWLLVKRSSNTDSWQLVDNMRGWPVGSSGNRFLYPNLSDAEYTGTTQFVAPTATGFQLLNASSAFNQSGETYIYIAIRRGPMRTPTSGTSVFSPALGQQISLPNFQSNSFPVDLATLMWRSGSEGKFWFNRLTGTYYLKSNATESELPDGSGKFDYQNGWYSNLSFDNTWISHQFRRAPSFFDVVCYTGTGSAGTITHNLGVAPELVITKGRGSVTNWGVYHASLGATKALLLNSTSAEITSANYWNNTAPTATQVSLGTTTNSSTTFVAYLFASCPGVSKVGSYTGNGSSQTINCGFAAGARFVMIKRTDSTGDWFVWDSARGIVAGNDPYFTINRTNGENVYGSFDTVDPTSSGFIVNEDGISCNASGATYIYLAVA